jgi:hypothetical protein
MLSPSSTRTFYSVEGDREEINKEDELVSPGVNTLFHGPVMTPVSKH